MAEKILMIKDIGKHFGGIKALQDVSFEVEKGKILGLIGPNGAGKTTLFNVINGVYAPDRGQITFHGREIQGLPPYRIADLGIARTFQIARPFLDMTVLENVLVGLGRKYYQGLVQILADSYRSEYLEKAGEILRLVDLEEFDGEKAGNLSLGYKRRLGIARALAIEPEVLMLDEPLAGISTEAIQKMLDLIARLKEKGKTLIIIEHNMEAIMRTCDSIVVLNQGTKIAEGLPDEVRNNPGVIEAYLGKDEG